METVKFKNQDLTFNFFNMPIAITITRTRLRLVTVKLPIMLPTYIKRTGEQVLQPQSTAREAYD